MTRRIFVTTLVLALAGLAAPQLAALADTNDRNNPQANSNQSNSEQHQATSSDSNKTKNDSKSSDNTAKSNRESQNDNRSSNSDNSATANHDRDTQDRDRDANRDNANRDQDSNSNRGHESARDNDNDRQSSDRSRDVKSQSNDRNDSRSDRNRNYKKDFKFGKSVDRGLTLSSVTHTSIFYKGGLRDNDVIVSYDGHRIHSENDFDRYVVYERGRVPVVVYRNGREQTIYVVYDDQEAVAQESGNQFFGAEFDRHSKKDGAIIIRIEEGSPADRAGLKREDIVTAINGDRVSSAHDAEETLSSLKSGQRVEVEYDRPGRNRQSHVQVTLGHSDRDSNLETTSYQTDDHPSAAVNVHTDSTNRDNDRDRRENNQDRRDDRRDNRGGLLPRLRN